MKFSINDKVIKELTEIQLKVLKDNIFTEELENDLSLRINWVVDRKIADSIKKLKEEWLPKLGDLDIKQIPVDDLEFAKLIFKQKEYKDRSSRDLIPPEKFKLNEVLDFK